MMISNTHRYIAIFLALLSSPAQAIDVERDAVRSFIRNMSTQYGFDSATVRTLLVNAQYQQSILDAMQRPAERSIPWHDYRERFVNPLRIAKGVAFHKQHRTTLQRLAESGAPVAEILGILGVETMYGEQTGRYKVLDALATLGFEYPPRSAFFLSQLEHFLLLYREQSIVTEQSLGSYAGAMGAPQFIPQSYRNFAVDGNNDGVIDLWTDWDDILASVTHYLTEHGWRPNEPIMTAATIADLDTDTSLFAYDSSTREFALDETVASLKSKGVQFTTTLPKNAPAMLLVFEDKTGPIYQVGFNNFYVITRYNRSTLYAAAVYALGQAIMQASE